MRRRLAGVIRGLSLVLSIGVVLSALAVSRPARAVRAVRPQIVRLVLDDTSVSPATSADSDPAMLFRMLSTRRAAFVGCYEREARLHPEVGSGTIVIATTIHPSTATTAVLDSDELARPAISTCATRVVTGFRFEPGPTSDVHFVVRLRYERLRSNEL